MHARCRAPRAFSRALPALMALGMVGGACTDRVPPADTLRLSVQSPAEALDPRFSTSAVAVRLSRLVFEPLFVFGDDLGPAPAIGETLTRVDDVTYDVTLHPRARFHDGAPVTADDVVYTFMGLGDDDVRSPHAAKFSWLKSVTALDPHTVRFALKEPYAPFPIELCSIGVVPARCRGKTAECRKNLVGAGPFAVVHFDPSEETLRLRAHKDHHRGAPQVPFVDVRVVRDGTTRLLELIDGKADLAVGDLSPTQLSTLDRYPALAIQRRPGLDYSYMAMNLRGPKADDDEETARTRRALSDVRVRRAIAHALDVDAVIQAKLKGFARRATGMLPPGHWAKDPALTSVPHDRERARALLDEAGFEDRGEDAGGRFQVVFSTTSNRLRRSIALVFAHQLRAVGIDVTVRVGEWATLYEDIKRGSFEMFSAKWTPVIEPHLFDWVFHSKSIPGPGKAGGNRGAYENADVDRWIDEGKAALDRDARAVPYQQIERQLLADLPYVPLWFEDVLAVARQDVAGFVVDRTGGFDGLAKARLVREGSGRESKSSGGAR